PSTRQVPCRSCDGIWVSGPGGPLGWRIMAFLAAVAWLKVGGLRHPKRFKRPAVVDGNRLGDHAHVVAALVQQHAPPCNKPMGALLKHRHLAGTWPDRQASELIDAVPGEGAEPLSQPQVR